MEDVQPVMECPGAVCPRCGSSGAVRILASRVGWMFDWVLCYGCGEVTVIDCEQ